MPNNIQIAITADTVQLQSQLAVAKASTAAFTQELNKLARQAASGGMTDELKAQLTQASEAMLLAKGRTTELANELKGTLTPATAGFGNVLSGMPALLGQLGVGLSVAGIAEFAEHALDAASAVQHFADVMSVPVDELQAYQFAARQAGVSSDDADTALKRFSANLGDLRANNAGPLVAALRELGLTADDLQGDPVQAMITFAKALDGIKDASERANIEREAFGRGGQDLNAMVGILTIGLKALENQTRDAGQMLDPKLTEAAEKGKIAMSNFATYLEDQVAAAIGGVIIDIGQLNKAAAGIDLGAADAKAFAATLGQVSVSKGARGSEQGEIAGLTAIDSKMAERKKLTDDLVVAQKALSDASALGDKAGIQEASQAVADLTRQMQDLNRVKADPAAARAQHDFIAELTAAQSEVNQIRTSDLAADITASKLKFEAQKNALDQEVEAGQITAAQKYEILKDLAAKTAELDIGALQFDESLNVDNVVKYNEDANKIKGIREQLAVDIANYSAEETAALKHQLSDQQKAYLDMNREVLSAEDQLISGIFQGRQKLGVQLEQFAFSLVQKEIEADLKYWTERELLSLEGVSKENAVEKGGLLMNLLFNGQKTASAASAQAQQTSAVVAGVAARESAETAGKAAGIEAQVAANSAVILNDAKTAAAGAYAAVVQIPVVGPILAPIAAGVAFGAVAAFDSLTSAEGGQLQVPYDGQLTQLHINESVLPANIATPMREFFADGGSSGDTHVHFHISAIDGRDAESFIKANADTIVKTLRLQHRNGAFAR